MDKEKQIEEMAKVLCQNVLTEYCASGSCSNSNCLVNAKALYTLYNAGYRKSSDVAREIFEEIEKTLKECLWFLKNHPSNYPSMDRTKINVYKDNLQYIAELKKKYTESEKKNAT